ncbi:TerC family protein [Parvibaculum sp.]|uniref:TerC family protein n=1 Tax=Parvibaculum sp. TaxID=2024848 RepID=UPI001B0E4ABF|nr:TerC family protein [Parvibaculum sp.]MBO6634305.1 TerC family protein [Parvibaculum sp.]MBO6680403.1 TerC family protein [Parvibaculum sp.]MBO6906106.1 TerC family protein [Parvibaculum sp.]
MFELFLQPENWASLATLTILEIVLGVDNLIFLSILASRLPVHQQKLGRQLGLGAAVITRLALLASAAWIVTLTHPVLDFGEYEISWRDLLLLAGGLFLMAKATIEIHHAVEGEGHETGGKEAVAAGLMGVIVQIAIIDIVFSFDTVMTAVGMSDHFPIMATAVIAAVIVMIFAAEPVSAFVTSHPTVKMLALSFLILIGVALIADGLHFHIPKAYLYFAVAFSVGVEMLNLWARKRRGRQVERV